MNSQLSSETLQAKTGSWAPEYRLPATLVFTAIGSILLTQGDMRPLFLVIVLGLVSLQFVRIISRRISNGFYRDRMNSRKHVKIPLAIYGALLLTALLIFFF
jgi:hypothetical protein